VKTTTPPDIAIFRAGTHRDLHGRDLSFSATDLQQIADSYDPVAARAPMVIGHPKTDDPAYGWVTGLRVDEAGQLRAVLDQVEPAFAGQVRAGRYRNVSASLWPPGHPNNPKPAGWYLRHVGVLGAAAPGVTGLPPIELAADDGAHVFEFSAENRYAWMDVVGMFRRLRDWMIESAGVEKADQVIPSWQIDSLSSAAQPAPAEVAPASTPSFAAPAPAPKEPPMSETQTADFAARESALATREQQLAAREAEIKTAEDAAAQARSKAARESAVSFAASLADAGQILPRHQPELVEVLLALPPAPVSFSASDGQPVQAEPAQLLRTFLSSLPSQIKYGEKSRDEGVGGGVASFAAPAGSVVDPRSLDLDRRARAHQAANPNTSYLDAVRAVGG
jgi:hypothetical protein